MIGEPLYDNDPINLGYLNTRLGGTTTLLLSKAQNFGTLPSTPYYKYNTYMGVDGIYICVNERLIGEYNPADWTKASTYVNVEDAFNEGIITAGILQAVNGGSYTAGITGQGTGDGSVRFWAGSTYANRANAPFRVTQGGTVTATNITITGGSVSGGLITSGINADNITAGTITGRTINGGSINGSAITADSSINITRGSYFFNVGLGTNHPNVSGINIGWGGASFGDKSISLQSGYYWNLNSGMIINCDGVRKDTPGNLELRNNVSGSNILIGNQIDMSSQAGNDGAGRLRLIWLNNMKVFNDTSGRQCIQAADGAIIRLGSALRLEGGGSSGVFAAGNGKASDLVLTGSGGASSQNVKKNIKKIEDDSYVEMLEILNEMNLYTYDYKYDLYAKREQYGFIIDEVEKIT